MIEHCYRLICDGCERTTYPHQSREGSVCEGLSLGWAVTTFDGGCLCPECVRAQVKEAITEVRNGCTDERAEIQAPSGTAG